MTAAGARYWPLVLDALGLPRWVSGTGQKTVLWVPCLTEKRSRAELADFEAEPERAMRRLPVLPEHPCSALSALLLVPVILLHLMRNGWRTLPGAFTALFPQTPSGWVDLFGMDTVCTRIFHEWHRAGTALFLHADAQHLTGNCVFAALFLWFLSRAAGPGWAMLVTVLGGTLGYCAEALLRTAPAVSIGFSTALFAAVGALSGLMSLHSRALAVPPLAAGAALLAMLGTEGENTDYMAHICGLACGTGLGLLLGLILRRFPSSAGPPGRPRREQPPSCCRSSVLSAPCADRRNSIYFSWRCFLCFRSSFSLCFGPDGAGSAGTTLACFGS